MIIGGSTCQRLLAFLDNFRHSVYNEVDAFERRRAGCKLAGPTKPTALQLFRWTVAELDSAARFSAWICTIINETSVQSYVGTRAL